jgi:hypothetical protein
MAEGTWLREQVSLAHDMSDRYCRVKQKDVIRLFMRQNLLTRTSVSLYHRHRFPSEIISHCVWLYFRFTLSFRDVEDVSDARGLRQL